MDVLTSETCWALNNWNNKTSDIKLVSLYSTIKMMHGPINIMIRYFNVKMRRGLFLFSQLTLSRGMYSRKHVAKCNKTRTITWRWVILKTKFWMEFGIQRTVHREISYNKSQQVALFLNFILINNSTCFGHICCPSSGVLILYSQQLVFVILFMLTVC